MPDWAWWEARCVSWLEERADYQHGQDAAHDMGHLRRVVANALALAAQEGALLDVVLPAAWLHDCVIVPKDSPQRPQASRLAAQAATAFLQHWHYPAQHLPAIAHAIEAHSFSAQIAPRSIEAKVVQDADRLDALGAIGIARCFAVGGSLGRRLYNETEPFPVQRAPDDTRNTLDHFYIKLLPIADTLQTSGGIAEGRRRRDVMLAFLRQLEAEIGAAPVPHHNDQE
jgi:uncharacterized protein